METIDTLEAEAVEEAHTSIEVLSEDDQEQADELRDIQEQMMELCRYALQLVRQDRKEEASHSKEERSCYPQA